MPWILLGGLSFALGYAVFQSGGVLTGDWNWCLLAIGVVTCLHMATSWREPAPPLDWISRGLLAAMVLLSLLQVVPLPVAVVRWLSPLRMEIAAAAFPVDGSVSWLTLSAVPDATWAELRSVLAFGLVCVVVRDLCARFDDRPWIVAAPLIVIAFLEAVLGLVQASLSGNEVARGTYVNRDQFAGFLEMVLPFAVLAAVAILRRHHRRFESPAGPALRACGLLVMAACVFIAILLSLSRMGFLAALASLFVMGTLSVGVARVGWKRWAPGLAVLVLVAAAIVYLPTDALIARFASLAATDQISSDTRAQIWQDSMGLVRAFPVAGCGVGAYES